MASFFQPAPGVALVAEIPAASSALRLETHSKNRTVKGQVIAVGPDYVSDAGICFDAIDYAQVGDTIFFLSYEGYYDVITLDNKDYYVVKFGDIRGKVINEDTPLN